MVKSNKETKKDKDDDPDKNKVLNALKTTMYGAGALGIAKILYRTTPIVMKVETVSGLAKFYENTSGLRVEVIHPRQEAKSQFLGWDFSTSSNLVIPRKDTYAYIEMKLLNMSGRLLRFLKKVPYLQTNIGLIYVNSFTLKDIYKLHQMTPLPQSPDINIPNNKIGEVYKSMKKIAYANPNEELVGADVVESPKFVYSS